MMTFKAFQDLAKTIARINDLPLDQAEEYVALVGDKPEDTENGRVVVRDDSGRELARLVWPYEE